MDTIDTHILSLLEKNGRISIKDLASQVALTAPAVKERMTKLEETGVIEGYKAVISPKKLNQAITAFILFETHNCKALQQFVTSYPDVTECHRLAGQYSYLVKISTLSMETLEAFIDKALQYGKSSTHLIFSSVINPIVTRE